MPTNPDDRISGQPLSSSRPRPGSPDLEPVDSLPSLAGGGDGGGLSSLAQSARQKQLSTARTTLIAIGILTVVINLIAFFAIKNQNDDAIRKAGLNPANLPAEVKVALAIDYGTTGGFVLLGIVFIVLGAIVRSYPVPCTIAGLVLFVLGWLISIPLNGAALAFVNPLAIVVKIVIIVALAKAVQAALAYQRESAEAATEYE